MFDARMNTEDVAAVVRAPLQTVRSQKSLKTVPQKPDLG